jgi:hypothetical protein
MTASMYRPRHRKRQGRCYELAALVMIRTKDADNLADLGIMPHVIEQILNHVSGHKGGVAGIYNRSS